MKLSSIKKSIVVISVFLGILEAKMPLSLETNNSTAWTILEKKLPLPSCASEEMQTTLKSIREPNVQNARKFISKTKEEWKDLVEYAKVSGSYGVKDMAKKYNVTIKKDMIDGVNVYYLTPIALPTINEKKLFIYLHGGAYIFGGGMSGLSEAILIASRTQVTVIAVDYRMPPDHPFPAPSEDVVSVYTSLIKSHPKTSIAMGGSSSGGGLTLASVHKLKALGLALPKALFVGTPWSDLTKSGDSLYVNEGIDRKIVSYDGFVSAAAKLYANGHDMKDSGLSPVYGDFKDFPPTMLVTGTRDLFLSFTVRVHRKMRAAGVLADLNVYEGLSHVEYFVVPDAPESVEVYSELEKFLKLHLR
ncbi:MAG TPA: steryl acetyl hydrolase [Sulfurovum sp.]|nr:steryl acetyl hydrolase [Sulfurovum sp.]